MSRGVGNSTLISPTSLNLSMILIASLASISLNALIVDIIDSDASFISSRPSPTFL